MISCSVGYAFVFLCGFFFFKEMNYLWVKYLDTRSVEINVTKCRNVDGLIELVKDKLSPALDSVGLQNITIHTSETALSLDPGIFISDIQNQEGYQKNTSKSPLIVKVKGN
jgi:hypothetical protein